MNLNHKNMENKIQRKKIFFFLIIAIVCTSVGVYVAPYFTLENSNSTEILQKPDESIEDFTNRMKGHVYKMAYWFPDNTYTVTISFKKYLPYQDVVKIFHTYNLTSATQVYYKVNSLKGPPSLAKNKSIEEQLQILKNNLIQDFRMTVFENDPIYKKAVAELEADKMFIGYITFEATPKIVKEILDNLDSVQVAQVIVNKDIPFAGIPPEEKN